MSEVVAVVRLKNFEERHFDIQHWWAESVRVGKLVGREGVPGGIARKPTRRLRDFVGQVLSDEAGRVDWDGGVDIVVFKSTDDEEEKWRWALRVEQLDGLAAFEPREVDDGIEVREVEPFDGANTPALAISNVDGGAANVGAAVALTGEGEQQSVELYLWPRRSGIAERHRYIGEAMEQQVAVRGHDIPVARSNLLSAHGQLHRAQGSRAAWPEMIAFFVDIERDEQTRGALEVELNADIPVADIGLLSAIADVLGDGDAPPLVQANDAVGAIGMDLDEGALSTVMDAAIPRAWLEMLSLRGPEERRAWWDSLQQLLAHQQGAATVAFFESPVPMGMTAEAFVAWKTGDAAATLDDAREVHRRLLDDYWVHLFGYDEFVYREHDDGSLGGEEVVLREKLFALGHGHGDAGVCWTVRGEKYLSYYGVHPCRRLAEVANFDDASPWPELWYHGSLRGLIDTLYISVTGSADELFEDDIEVELTGRRVSQEHLRLSARFSDLTEVAQLVDAIPTLREFWDPESLFGPDRLTPELDLNRPTYQEAGLTVIGIPGFGGALPTSFLLGMPFSYPPIRPMNYRHAYFTDPEDDHGHGHSHDHSHGHSH